MKHIDLFSGIKTTLVSQGHNPCGLSRHDKLGIESIPCQVSCSSLNAKNHYGDTAACGQCPRHEFHRKIDKSLVHQGILPRTYAYCYPSHSCHEFVHSILLSFADCVHRILTGIPLHFSYYKIPNNVVCCTPHDHGNNQAQRTFRIDGNSVLAEFLYPYSADRYNLNTSGNSIYAMRFRLQKVAHRLCNILFCLPLCPPYHEYNIKDKVCQLKEGDNNAKRD